MDREFRGEMMDSDTFNSVKDMGFDGLKEMSKTGFQLAASMKNRHEWCCRRNDRRWHVCQRCDG